MFDNANVFIYNKNIQNKTKTNKNKQKIVIIRRNFMCKENISKLFKPDLIYIEDFNEQDEAFEKISYKLLEKGLVKEEYLEALKNREEEFPTGIDLSVVDSRLPNVAIPHTESGFCNITKVVVTKLKNELSFKNMMDSSKELKVRYLFMILNATSGEQVNILANLMEFVTNKENMDNLERANTIDEIYKVVSQ